MAFIFQTLFSGSDGNSAFISDGKTNLLIDCGMGIKAMEHALISRGTVPCEISAILITHEHIDHVRGAEALSMKYDIPVYATPGTWEAQWGGKDRRISPKNRIAFDVNCDFYIDDFNIQPFSIPHDANEPCGYCISSHDKKAVTATDMGHTTSEFFDRARDADIILLESNYDLNMLRTCAYPQSLKRRITGKTGHLSNNECATALSKLIGFKKLRAVLLGHLSQNSNTPELAYNASLEALTECGVKVGADIMLSVAGRGAAGIPIQL